MITDDLIVGFSPVNFSPGFVMLENMIYHIFKIAYFSPGFVMLVNMIYHIF